MSYASRQFVVSNYDLSVNDCTTVRHTEPTGYLDKLKLVECYFTFKKWNVKCGASHACSICDRFGDHNEVNEYDVESITLCIQEPSKNRS